MPKQSDTKDHRKACTLCSQLRDVLVRCQVDDTGKWHFVCPGVCWKRVSGGVIDGDGGDDHKFYRYGGMWKNKHEAVSAKKKSKDPQKGKDVEAAGGGNGPDDETSKADGAEDAEAEI